MGHHRQSVDQHQIYQNLRSSAIPQVQIIKHNSCLLPKERESIGFQVFSEPCIC